MNLSIQLPDDIGAALRRSPTEIEKDLRLGAAIDWYRRGMISQGRAAEIAGLARGAFLDELAARKIDVFYVDVDELKREVERV